MINSESASTTPIALIEDSPCATNLCRSLEAKLQKKPELFGMCIPVETLDNFDDFPESQTSDVYKNSTAVYRQSTKTIYLNRARFFGQDDDIQEAIVAHEIGHALAHRDSLIKNNLAYSQLDPVSAEEYLADRLACLWGFFDGLRKERLSSYGRKYVEGLELWQDEASYIDAMVRWHTLKHAGLVGPD